MMKQLISVILSTALVLFSCTGTFGASTQGEKEAKQTADVKARITKLGTATLVEVKLRDKTKLKGYVHKIAEDHFVISDLKTDTTTTVAYAQVRQVKQVKDHHLSDRQMSVIAAVIVTVLFTWANWTDKP